MNSTPSGESGSVKEAWQRVIWWRFEHVRLRVAPKNRKKPNVQNIINLYGVVFFLFHEYEAK